MLFPFLILMCLAYLAFAAATIAREPRRSDSPTAYIPHPATKFILGGGVPLAVTATMSYLFLIADGATTVQLNVGSPSRMSAWSTWVHLWPVFLFLTAAGSVGTLIWIAVCVFRKPMRQSIPASVFSFLFSVLAFFTVATYFPSV